MIEEAIVQLQEILIEDRQELRRFMSGLARLAKLEDLDHHTRKEVIEAWQ